MSTPDPREIARQVILDHTEDIEYTAIGEIMMGEDGIDELSDDAREALHRRIDELVSAAKVTVTLPGDTPPRLSIDTDAFGQYGGARIEVDGHDISTAVSSLGLTLKPGALPEVTLGLVVWPTPMALSDADLTIPRNTHGALVALGWTPPSDHPASVTTDDTGALWLRCDLCETTLVEIEDADRLSVLVTAADLHKCAGGGR